MESDLRNGWQAFLGPQFYFLLSRKIGITLKKDLEPSEDLRSMNPIGTHRLPCQADILAGKEKPLQATYLWDFANVLKLKKSQCSL